MIECNDKMLRFGNYECRSFENADCHIPRVLPYLEKGRSLGETGYTDRVKRRGAMACATAGVQTVVFRGYARVTRV